MAPAHIIDVDKPALIDLTEDPPTIDLTLDAEDEPEHPTTAKRTFM
jgi:hypothetical protein